MVDVMARSAGPHHKPWRITEEARDTYRETSRASREAKLRALRGDGPTPLHPVNVPRLDPLQLMPQQPPNGIRSLSLFSGGGGLDLAFDRAGFDHQASYEILGDAAATLAADRPSWTVFGGGAGDVNAVDWRSWRGQVELVHGGPPCQPFSVAGRQRGAHDDRDMFPRFVDCVLAVEPAAFVAENVAALGGAKFRPYLQRIVLGPLSSKYTVFRLDLRAELYGVPQQRRRLILVGFRNKRAAARWQPPRPNSPPSRGHRIAVRRGRTPSVHGSPGSTRPPGHRVGCHCTDHQKYSHRSASYNISAEQRLQQEGLGVASNLAKRGCADARAGAYFCRH